MGLGSMGALMAQNVANGGFSVTAYNRTRREVDLGPGSVVDSVAEAVAGADAVFVMVSDGAAVRHVLFGPDQAADSLKKGAVVVNMSTIGVEETRQIALELANLGVDFVDAPVSGSVGPAKTGDLVILAGGSEATVNQLRPVFLTMGKTLFHLGPISSGAAMKLVVNSYLGLTLQTASECMALADKSGLGRERFLEVLQKTGMWSPVVGAKKAMWLSDEYPAAFALKHMTKDLSLTSAFATTLSVGTPAILTALATFLAAQAQGLADEDMAAVAQHIARMAGNDDQGRHS
ncbi:NAD(P)-dependent oxidoreductase [Alicyclobacillus tolerans]|nr:NAD(P)-dependent oxidoreductase [Alicyclobacillus tolerans]